MVAHASLVVNILNPAPMFNHKPPQAKDDFLSSWSKTENDTILERN